MINQNGFRAIGKPTGRPLLQSSLQSYTWDYSPPRRDRRRAVYPDADLRKESPQVFAEAIDTLDKQYENRNQLRPWIPQVTVDPDAPNGTTVKQARACLEEAKERGLSGAVLWWSPNFVDRAVAFIALLNADAAL